MREGVLPVISHVIGSRAGIADGQKTVSVGSQDIRPTRHQMFALEGNRLIFRYTPSIGSSVSGLTHNTFISPRTIKDTALTACGTVFSAIDVCVDTCPIGKSKVLIQLYPGTCVLLPSEIS